MGAFCLAPMRPCEKRPRFDERARARVGDRRHAGGGPAAKRRDEAKPNNPSAAATVREAFSFTTPASSSGVFVAPRASPLLPFLQERPTGRSLLSPSRTSDGNPRFQYLPHPSRSSGRGAVFFLLEVANGPATT
jgi:hypothetical protein